MNNELVKVETDFGTPGSFEHTQRVAKMLSSSSLIPKEYQGNIQNTMIAMEMANRIGVSPLMVMQNLDIIHGKPSWSSKFVIAALNSCNKFSQLRYEMSGEGDEYGCIAYAFDVETKERLEGPKVTLAMVKAEGWLTKTGSKWKTMPELMFRYRAAAFFGRLYAPEILMGMMTVDEAMDIQKTSQIPEMNPENPKWESAIKSLKENKATIDDILEDFVMTEENIELIKSLSK